MKEVTKKEFREAEKVVEEFNKGDLLGHNTKLLEDGETYQKKLSATLRVQFKVNEEGANELIEVFHKENHKSHR